jgi:hypothetical protein
MKRCFRQGNHTERRMLLKALVEAVYEEYTEDNWYTRYYWLVEEILKSDDLITQFPIDESAVAAGLRVSVHDAIEFKKSEKKCQKVI